MYMRTCSKCKQDLPLTEFNKKSNRKDGLQPFCRECNRARSRQYYAENKEKHKMIVGKRKQQKIEKSNAYVTEVLVNSSCADCQENNILVLEFDHVTGEKRNSISLMVNGGYSIEAIKEEIKKCEIVCSNCHAIRTHQRGNTFKWRFSQGHDTILIAGS